MFTQHPRRQHMALTLCYTNSHVRTHTHTHRMKVLSIYENKFVIIITDLKAHLYPSFILLRNHSIFSINWNVENDDSHCTKE